MGWGSEARVCIENMQETVPVCLTRATCAGSSHPAHLIKVGIIEVLVVVIVFGLLETRLVGPLVSAPHQWRGRGRGRGGGGEGNGRGRGGEGNEVGQNTLMWCI